MSRIIKYLIICCLFTLSCTRPTVEEYYIKTQSLKKGEDYTFLLDLSDSSCTYDISLYLSLSCNNREYENFSSLALDLSWSQAGDSTVYRERVFVGKEMQIPSNFFTKNFRTAYREAMRLKKNGFWKLSISSQRQEKGQEWKLNGIGLRLIRKENGTS